MNRNFILIPYQANINEITNITIDKFNIKSLFYRNSPGQSL